MGKHSRHAFRSDAAKSIRRPAGQHRDGNVTHPPPDAPVVTVILTNPGARAQAIPTNMEASVASIEPKRILTRIEQCAADAAELPTLQASSGIASVVLDMIDLIVTPSTGIGATKTEINERSSPEAVTAYTAMLISEISTRIKERGDFESIANFSASGVPDVVAIRHKEAKLGFSGQFKVRVFAANAEYLQNTIACIAITTPSMASVSAVCQVCRVATVVGSTYT